MPGATIEEVRQVLMQVAKYARFPAVNAAFRVPEHELSNIPNDQEEGARVNPRYSGVLIERQPHVVLRQTLSCGGRASDVVQLGKLPAPIEGIFFVESM